MSLIIHSRLIGSAQVTVADGCVSVNASKWLCGRQSKIHIVTNTAKRTLCACVFILFVWVLECVFVCAVFLAHLYVIYCRSPLFSLPFYSFGVSTSSFALCVIFQPFAQVIFCLNCTLLRDNNCILMFPTNITSQQTHKNAKIKRNERKLQMRSFFSLSLSIFPLQMQIEMKAFIIRRRQSISLYVHINTCTVMLS